MKTGYVLLALVCIVSLEANNKEKSVRPLKLKEKLKKGNPFDRMTPKRVNGYVKNIFEDTRSIGRNIFSLDTMKIMTATMPFYLSARRANNRLQRQFYNAEVHENKHQPPKFMCDIALKDEYIMIPFLAIAATGFIHHDPYNRRRAQLFTNGLIWCFSLKVLLKEIIKTDGNLRPWNEKFSSEKRSYGGLPSGHMTITTYMAVFWGLEKGRKYGVPLGLFTAYALSMNVACNHHYLSQAIAGMGLGAIIGVATQHAFKDLTMPKDMHLGFGVNDQGKLGIRFAYDF